MINISIEFYYYSDMLNFYLISKIITEILKLLIYRRFLNKYKINILLIFFFILIIFSNIFSLIIGEYGIYSVKNSIPGWDSNQEPPYFIKLI